MDVGNLVAHLKMDRKSVKPSLVAAEADAERSGRTAGGRFGDGFGRSSLTKIVAGLEEYGAFEDTLIILGVVIPDKDKEPMREAVVDAIFGPGTPMSETIEFVRENAP